MLTEDLSVSIEGVPKNDPEALRKSLVKRVESMIQRGRQQNPNMEPLIRLRVEIDDDFDKIPPQRFGADFVGRVANPDDIILYAKKKRKDGGVTAANARSEASILRARDRDDAALAKQTVEQEVSRILSTRAKHMSVLPESKLAVALTNYV